MLMKTLKNINLNHVNMVVLLSVGMDKRTNLLPFYAFQLIILSEDSENCGLMCSHLILQLMLRSLIYAYLFQKGSKNGLYHNFQCVDQLLLRRICGVRCESVVHLQDLCMITSLMSQAPIENS